MRFHSEFSRNIIAPMNRSKVPRIFQLLGLVPWLFLPFSNTLPLYQEANKGHNIGHCISHCPFAYHGNDSRATSRPLGIDYWGLCDVPFIGLEFIFNQYYSPDSIPRNRFWYRRVSSIHTFDPVYVRVVRQTERSCVRGCMGGCILFFHTSYI